MRQLLKFLHTLGAIGMKGDMIKAVTICSQTICNFKLDKLLRQSEMELPT